MGRVMRDEPVKFATEEVLPVRIQLIHNDFSFAESGYLFVGVQFP